VPRTGTPFPYIDRRCQARTALIVSMWARRWPPARDSVANRQVDNIGFPARAPGLCVDCGTYFDVGDVVEYARYGDPRQRRRGLAHAYCPDWSEILDNLRQDSDHRLITHAAIAGRSRAGCGHVTEGTQVFLSHGSGEHALNGIGTWVCADCARK
jgi:hypothetical protein